MKKYLLFTWSSYEARGGFTDFINSFDNLEELINETIIQKNECGHNHYQVVDRDTFEIIEI